jgi:ethanolamine utilization protein EutM
MEKSLGILETKGYAAAYSAADKILENSDIELIKIEKIGGGIISVFFKGDNDSLKAAFEKGIQQARLVGEIIALNIINEPNKKIEKLLSQIEQTSFRATEVRSEIEKERTIPLKVEVEIEKTEVQKPIKVVNATTESNKKNKSSKFLSSTSTIQRLRREALSSENISKEKEAKPKNREGKESSQINLSKIENMNVHELRRLARGTNGFPIQGREISKANRKELLNYFKEIA